MGGAVRRRLVVVAVAMACACGALAPAADASVSVPTGGPPLPFTGSGTSGTSAAIASFEAAAGGGDNGTIAGEQNGGFRHVTWDQIALDGSDPGSTTIEPGQVIAPAPTRLESWGLELGPEIAVSDDGFQSVNSGTFTPFSPANAWGTFNTTTANLQVVVPAGQGSTPTPAQSRGLGIVFLDVTGSTQVQIQYYNGDTPLLQTPLSPPVGTTSFAGLLFPDPIVTRVVVTLGGAEMFGWDGTTVTPGGSNSVAGDDVVLAEPEPARSNVGATAGVPISTVLDTFTETDPNAYVTAVIDWGDGTRTAGAIAPAPDGAFNVTGTHAYARTGDYTVIVTVDDSTPSEQTSNTIIQVGPRASATSVICSPSPVAVTAATTCTTVVSDVGAGGPIAPTGLVALSSPTAGAAFAEDSGCVLAPDGTPGVSICQVLFTPSQLPPNRARITADYDGDLAHGPSDGLATVAIRPQHCSLRALSTKLSHRPVGLGVVVTCDARANVQITVTAAAARTRSFKQIRLQFGVLKAAVTAGRPTVLVIKPAPGVLPILRAATRRHRRVSLKLTLVASSHATRATTTTRASALRIR